MEGTIINVGYDWIDVHFDGFETKYDKKIYVDPSHKDYELYTVRLHNDTQNASKLKTFSKKQLLTQQMKDCVERTRTLLKNKRYDDAISAIELFLSVCFDETYIDDDNRDLIGEIYLNYALCFGQMQDYLRGIEEVNKCIDIHPKCVKAYSTLALFYGFDGEINLALSQYEKALTLDMTEDDRKDIQQRMMHLKQKQMQRINEQLSDESDDEDPETQSDSDYDHESDSDYRIEMETESDEENGHEHENEDMKAEKATSLEQLVANNKDKLDKLEIDWQMSKDQQKAYDERKNKPNNFYYRLNIEGTEPKKGKWSKQEKQLFMQQLLRHGANNLWGPFSIPIVGRVGYTCSSLYGQMRKEGKIIDENYVRVNKNGKDGWRYMKKAEVMALAGKESKNKNFAQEFRKFQFIVVEDPSGTFKNLPCQHPNAPIKRTNLEQLIKATAKKRGEKVRKKENVKKVREKKKKRSKERKKKKSKKKRKGEEPNPEFCCPINYDLMEDPVIVRQSGCTYERSAIVEWIKENGTCPNTRAVITVNDLIPNRTLRKAIENWKKEAGFV